MNKKRRKNLDQAFDLIEDAYPPETGVSATIGSLQYCITALEEVQQYRGIGTVEECREAVEKQRAIPITIGVQNFYKCPKCQSVLKNTDKYCHECGQAIQWDENLEGTEDENT